MVVFVILHYKSIQDTLLCIDSIKKINGQYKIVVVDNHSDSSEDTRVLRSLPIDLITLDENIGFAKGNNVGCNFGIEKYDPDFLCVINSDTILNQIDFVDRIKKNFNEHCFDVLGPKILPEGLDSSNPFPVYRDLETVRRNIKYTERAIKIYSNKYLYVIFSFYSKCKNFLKDKPSLENGKMQMKNVGLHGCALIFSKKYIDRFKPHIFFNETFLYHEEEFLYYRCQKEKLFFLYDPSIEIIHNEGQSLNKKIKNHREKMMFRFSEILKSLSILEKVMKEGKSI